MKSQALKSKALISRCVFLAVMLISIAGMASAAPVLPDSVPGSLDPSFSIFAGIVAALSAKYGLLAALISWVGILRIFFKPITTAIENAVRNSPSVEDDKVLAEVEASRGWKLFCWGLDLLASIKVGTQVTVKAEGPSDPRNDGYVPGVVMSMVPPRDNVQGQNPNDKGNPNSKGQMAVLVLWAAAVACALTGCASLLDKAGSAVSSPRVQVVTNTVTVVQTNLLPVAVAVPGETRFVTNIVERLTTNFVDRISTVTNFVEKPALAEGIKVAQIGAAVAPPPYGPIAAGVLGVVSAGLGFLVTRKNGQVNALTDQNDSLAKQLQAVVQGVEQTTTAIDPATGGKVKGIIADVSKALGVSDDLHATVKAITS